MSYFECLFLCLWATAISISGSCLYILFVDLYCFIRVLYVRELCPFSVVWNPEFFPLSIIYHLALLSYFLPYRNSQNYQFCFLCFTLSQLYYPSFYLKNMLSRSWCLLFFLPEILFPAIHFSLPPSPPLSLWPNPNFSVRLFYTAGSLSLFCFSSITCSSQALRVFLVVSQRYCSSPTQMKKWELTSSVWSAPQETKHMVHWSCHCPKHFGDNFFKNFIQRQLKALQGKQSCVLKACFSV